MKTHIILASESEIRQSLLSASNVDFTSMAARIDETLIKESMISQGDSHPEIALELADQKGKKLSIKNPDATVIACDQVLSFGSQIMSKPATEKDVLSQLKQLRNKTHTQISAVVVFQNGQRIWHHIGKTDLTMADFSDTYLQHYVQRNWNSIKYSVGGYKIEEEGIRLFTNINGSYHNILGLPLLELLAYLKTRGDIET